MFRRKSNFAALLGGAVLTAVASSLCCIGPLVYLVFGVSAATLSSFGKMSRFQIPLMIVSLALVVYGFQRLHFSSRPLCAGPISRAKLLWLYWLSVPVILFFILYPFLLPLLYERAE